MTQIDEFKTIGPTVLASLEARGFHRRADLEDNTPTGVSLVYVGQRVGFKFGLDVRDECMGVNILWVHDGQVTSSRDCGFPDGLLAYLKFKQRQNARIVYPPGKKRRKWRPRPVKETLESLLADIQWYGPSLLEDSDMLFRVVGD